jgi:hypothetical protein
MVNVLPIPFSLNPGASVVLWQTRMVERHSSPLPIIEILPENHGDASLDYFQRQGISFYDRKGKEALLDQKGQRINLYC